MVGHHGNDPCEPLDVGFTDRAASLAAYYPNKMLRALVKRLRHFNHHTVNKVASYASYYGNLLLQLPLLYRWTAHGIG